MSTEERTAVVLAGMKARGSQRIGFCSAPDDVRIAYAVCGEGPGWPLERVATWLTHREYDGGVYRHWLAEVGADRRRVVRGGWGRG